MGVTNWLPIIEPPVDARAAFWVVPVAPARAALAGPAAGSAGAACGATDGAATGVTAGVAGAGGIFFLKKLNI